MCVDVCVCLLMCLCVLMCVCVLGCLSMCMCVSNCIYTTLNTRLVSFKFSLCDIIANMQLFVKAIQDAAKHLNTIISFSYVTSNALFKKLQ